jgi:hypothetical protein
MQYQLCVECAILNGLFGPSVRLDCEFVLGLTTNAVFAAAILGTASHVFVVVNIPQAVFDDAIEHLAMSQPLPVPQCCAVIWYVGHTFHSPSHHAVLLPEHYTLSS